MTFTLPSILSIVLYSLFGFAKHIFLSRLKRRLRLRQYLFDIRTVTFNKMPGTTHMVDLLSCRRNCIVMCHCMLQHCTNSDDATTTDVPH